MNNINRPLIKSQAKQIIKNKVFMLFIISAIAIFLVQGISAAFNAYDSKDDISDLLNSSENYSDDYDEYDNYDDFDDDDLYEYFYGNGSSGSYSNGSSDSDNPIESFGKNQSGSGTSASGTSSTDSLAASMSSLFAGNFISLVSFVLSPLLVTLYGYYISLVKRNPDEEISLGADLKKLFKDSFGSSYGKKIWIYALRGLFVFLWALLLIIPGIVYYYSSYFAYQIMCEYPNLKSSEALKLSKKMVKGNRGELFWLDLSFIGWDLLCCVTLGIASIYVIPYYMTTQALYYENFKIRALQEGRIFEDDFLSAEEKAMKYGCGAYAYSNPNMNYNGNNGQQNAYNGAGSYTQNGQAYQNNGGNGGAPNGAYYDPSQDSGNKYYYNPAQSAPQNAEDVQNAGNAANDESAENPQTAADTQSSQAVKDTDTFVDTPNTQEVQQDVQNE